MNYSALTFDELDSTPMPFTDAFIDRWAGELPVCAKLLAEALEDAFYEYLSLKITSNRFEQWHQARYRFETINRLLSRTIEQWKKTSLQNREAFDLLIADRLRFDELQAQLHLIQCDVQEVIEWGTREKGNQGRARRPGSKGVDLEPLKAFTRVIQRFWEANIDDAFGIKFDRDFAKGDPNNPKSYVPEPTSPGIQFLHECLNALEPHFDAASCHNLMRKLRAHG